MDLSFQYNTSVGRLDSPGPDPESNMPEETLSASALKQAFQFKDFTEWKATGFAVVKGFGNPKLFDNSYFQILLQRPWKISVADGGMTSMIGLATDRALTDDEECLKWLKVYAADQGRFFTDFAAVYTKLVITGARWGPSIQA